MSAGTDEAGVPAGIEVVSAPDGRRARVRFEGPFEGRTVTWDAEILSLAAASEPGADAGTGGRSYIEIGEDRPEGTPIRIGLAVQCIDLAAVYKAVIMVRQYKRLRRGRHEFGAPVE